MSRLTEPNFEEIYLLVRDIAARAGEADVALEETLEAMAVKFRVIQVAQKKPTKVEHVNMSLDGTLQGLSGQLLHGVEKWDSLTGTQASEL